MVAAVTQRELYLLVLRFLEGGPCTEASDALRRETELYGLLGERTDWRGATSAASFGDASSAAGSLPPPDHLQALLTQLLALSHAQRPASERTDAPPLTLLGSGSRSLVTVALDGTTTSAPPTATDTPASGRRLGQTDGTGILGSHAPPPPSEHWSRVHRAPLPPVQDACIRCKPAGGRPGHFVPFLFARELGVRPRRLRCLYESVAASGAPSVAGEAAAAHGSAPVAAGGGATLAPALGAGSGGRMRAIAAFRGHLCAAYCVLYDGTGRRILTGADDGNVKVWCATSGLLQRTLRGHTAEITEVLLSPDNQLVVSASLDATVRVWSLSRGAPVAVLLHASPVNAIAFSPTVGWTDQPGIPGGEHASSMPPPAAPAAPDAGAERGQPFLLTVASDGATRLYDALNWSAPPLLLAQSPAQAAAAATMASGNGPAGGGVEASAAVVLLENTNGASGTAHGGEASVVGGSSVTATCCAVSCSGLYACVGTTIAPYLHVWSLSGARGLFESSAASRQLRAVATGLPTPPPPAPPRPWTLAGHRAEITSAVWSPCGHELLTGSRDGSARVWSWFGSPAAPRVRLFTQFTY